jgi:hypothetical protein
MSCHKPNEKWIDYCKTSLGGTRTIHCSHQYDARKQLVQKHNVIPLCNRNSIKLDQTVSYQVSNTISYTSIYT